MLLSAIDFPFIVKLHSSFKGTRAISTNPQESCTLMVSLSLSLYISPDNANLFMSMEYVCGGELFTVLRKCFRFEEARVKFYAAQITLALEYLQFMGVVYR